MDQSHSRRRDPQPARALDPWPDAPPPAIRGPLIVRFLGEDDDEYLVGEPEGRRTARVPKRRALAESPYPDKKPRGSSERLMRWSTYALIGVVFGGILGIALGSIVVLAALVRLTALSSRIHRWLRRHHSQEDSWQMLPAQATRERIQLLAALGQGFLGIVLGSIVLFAIVAMK